MPKYLGKELSFKLPVVASRPDTEGFVIKDAYGAMLVADGLGEPHDMQYIVDAINEYEMIRTAVAEQLESVRIALENEIPVPQRFNNPAYDAVLRILHQHVERYYRHEDLHRKRNP